MSMEFADSCLPFRCRDGWVTRAFSEQANRADRLQPSYDWERDLGDQSYIRRCFEHVILPAVRNLAGLTDPTHRANRFQAQEQVVFNDRRLSLSRVSELMRDRALGDGVERPLRMADFVVTGMLGRGAHATVFQANYLHPNSHLCPASSFLVALKCVPMRGRSHRTSLQWDNEVVVIDELRNCPHAVQMHGKFTENNRHFIVLELLQGGSLKKACEYFTEGFPQTLLLHLSEELLKALSSFHGRDVTHGDLHEENIMFVEELRSATWPRVKLIDFERAVAWNGYTACARFPTCQHRLDVRDGERIPLLRRCGHVAQDSDLRFAGRAILLAAGGGQIRNGERESRRWRRNEHRFEHDIVQKYVTNDRLKEICIDLLNAPFSRRRLTAQSALERVTRIRSAHMR